MPKKNQKSAKPSSSSPQIPYLKLFMAILAIIVLPLSYLFRQTLKLTSSNLPSVSHECDTFFTNHTYNAATYGKDIKTVFIGQIHGSNEQYVAECLESLVSQGDHLLIEATGNGRETRCDEVHEAYQRFNGKLKCYGFDVGIDDARRTYSDLAFRANFISQKSAIFFSNADSGKAVIERMIDFGDTMLKQSHSMPSDLKKTDPEFLQRNGKYVKNLAKKMSGLNIPEMQQFLIKENNRLAELANYYEKKSRKGPTNTALISQIISHQQQLQGSKYRLFAVAGKKHFDLRHNKELKEKVIDKGEPITILSPK